MSKGEGYWKRKFVRLCMVVLAGVMCMMPVMASEKIDVKYPSEWAVQAVLEGQNYGIYPLEWHDNFRKKINKAEVRTLQQGIGEKVCEISGVKLKLNAQDKAIKDNTRGEVLRQLFLEIKKYDYPIDLGLDQIDALAFMKANNIVSASAVDLRLDKPCTIEEAIVFGTRIVDWVYDKLDAGSKGYFWKVEGGKNTVYLFGSIHAADARLYPFDKEILKAYDSSDVIGFEIDDRDEKDYAKFAELTSYSDGTSLKDHVSEKTYDLVTSCSKALGLTNKQMDNLKVWYLSNYISTLSLSDTRDVAEAQEAVDFGIDNYFFYKAVNDDKEIYGLESYESQAQMFDSFSDELQEYLLLENLYNFYYSSEDLSKDSEESLTKEEIEQISNLWLTLIKAGDVEGFRKYYDTSDIQVGDEKLTKEYIEKLLTKRDMKMAEKIEACLKNDSKNTYFIIVGAAHYISATNNSVIDQLRKKGYTITQIK